MLSDAQVDEEANRVNDANRPSDADSNNGTHSDLANPPLLINRGVSHPITPKEMDHNPFHYCIHPGCFYHCKGEKILLKHIDICQFRPDKPTAAKGKHHPPHLT